MDCRGTIQMPSLLARADLRTHYVRDPFAIETLDLDQIIDELAAASPGGDPARWIGRTSLTEYDHLVLATDRRSGQCLGLLAAQDMLTEREEAFLFLRTGFVAEWARGHGLMRRMVVLMLLRADVNGALPTIIAARTNSGTFFRVLHDFAIRIPGVRIHPNPDAIAINLLAAGLARRIARQVGAGVRYEAGTSTLRGGLVAAGGAVLAPAPARHSKIDALFGSTVGDGDQILALMDLRDAAEEIVIEQARRIYRRN